MSYHQFHSRRNLRLKGYDYSQPGYYFVTICCGNRQRYFGRIEDQGIKFSPIGEIAQKYWKEIPDHFNQVELDRFVTMPDHIHGILVL